MGKLLRETLFTRQELGGKKAFISLNDSVLDKVFGLRQLDQVFLYERLKILSKFLEAVQDHFII